MSEMFGFMPKKWYNIFIVTYIAVLYGIMVISPHYIFIVGFFMFVLFTHMVVNLPFLKLNYSISAFSSSQSEILSARVKIIFMFLIFALISTSLTFMCYFPFMTIDSAYVWVEPLDTLTAISMAILSSSFFILAMGCLLFITHNIKHEIAAWITIGLIFLASLFLIIPLYFSRVEIIWEIDVLYLAVVFFIISLSALFMSVKNIKTWHIFE